MKKTIRLYWQEICAPVISEVEQVLSAYFPLDVALAGAREPSAHAFDTARGQYDAEYLLKELDEAESENTDEALSLWLIEEDISCAGYDYLYGAAGHATAVVSAARTGFGENLHKEVCHETGHLFGLDHCHDSCVMNTSPGPGKLGGKPTSFCVGCLVHIFKEDR